MIVDGREWRYGIPEDTELDSLADRLIWDAALRATITNPSAPVDPMIRRTANEWRARAVKLANYTRTTYEETLERVLRRAIAGAQAGIGPGANRS